MNAVTDLAARQLRRFEKESERALQRVYAAETPEEIVEAIESITLPPLLGRIANAHLALLRQKAAPVMRSRAFLQVWRMLDAKEREQHDEAARLAAYIDNTLLPMLHQGFPTIAPEIDMASRHVRASHRGKATRLTTKRKSHHALAAAA